MITDTLSTIFMSTLQHLGVENPDIHLEHPAELSHGDYATNVAMRYAKELGSNPRELAEKILEQIDIRAIDEIESINIAGPGFINIQLSPLFFSQSLQTVIQQEDHFGKNQNGTDKKVIVEYSSPNIAKPFTVGHLRSTIIGDAVARLLHMSGWDVLRDNHLGDWGTQFGKLIVAIKKWGNEEALDTAEDPIKDLVALYVRFHDEAEKEPRLVDEGRAWFTRLEQGDAEARRLWEKCIGWSMIEFQKVYDQLGVDFDMKLGESFFEDKMQTVIDDLKGKDFYRESEDAQLIFFPDEKYPPLMILKKDGSTLYATRDLATDKYRKQTWNPDLVINEVGAEQSLYFQQIFETEAMLGYFNRDQRVHVKHGLFRFKEGKMSTRKGNVIWLQDVINEAKERVVQATEHEQKPELIHQIAIGAIKFNDLKRESHKDIVFDWDELLNLKGDSGPYLQYTYARCKSVVSKSKEHLKDIRYEPHASRDITDVDRLLYRFPEVIELATKEYAPHHVANYLLELARAFNSWYGTTQIIVEDDKAGTLERVQLVAAVATIIKNGLWVLGIEAPETM
ncbi:arginine--tRNA ligase [Candidatus Nomurabacteria bacterium]|nr:arginine--tRNA ligase [Candidatus Nomurabacteria bacterium]